MERLLSSILSASLLSVTAAVLGLLLSLRFLSPRGVGPTVRGLGRLLARVVSYPVGWLRAAVAGIGSDAPPSFSATATDFPMTPLAYRLVRAAVAVMAVLAVGVGFASLVGAVGATVGEVTSHYSARRDAAQQRALTARADSVVQALVARWERDSATSIAAVADSLRAVVQRAETMRAQALESAASRPRVAATQLRQLINELPSGIFATRPQAAARTQARIDAFFASVRAVPAETATGLGFVSSDSATISQVAAAWMAGQVAAAALDDWPRRRPRLPIEAQIEEARDTHQKLAQATPDSSTHGMGWLAARVGLVWVTGITGAITSLLGALASVWVAGLLLEYARFTFEVADAIRSNRRDRRE